MSWYLLCARSELTDAADRGHPGQPTVRFAPRAVRLANRDTGELREWAGGLDAFVETLDFYKRLCERTAEALGPDVLQRWEDGDDSLDLAVEVAAVAGGRGACGYARPALDEARR